MKVKRLPARRWREFRRIRLEALRSDPAAFGSAYEEEVGFRDEVWKQRVENCLFALDGDEILGVISLVINDRVKLKHVANIYGFYVRRTSRGAGVGTLLLSEAIRRARAKRGTRKVALSVNPKYKAALSLYRKAGFEVTGRARGEIRVGKRFYDMLSMELNL